MKIPAHVLLRMIERLVGDDFCCDLEMYVHGDGGPQPTQREIGAQQKLSQIYRLVHSLDQTHSCHHVHKSWRKEIYKMLIDTKVEMADEKPRLNGAR